MSAELALRLRAQFACAAGACVVLGIAGLARSAFAGERVMLSNGFDIRCDHHAQVGSQVRLYLNSGESSYIEFRQDQITGVEHVADPPPDTAGAVSANNNAANQDAKNKDAKNKDAKLRPADLHEMLAEAGQQHNLDVDLLASVVKAESNGDSRAVSRAGARGLMQLMPKTAADHGVDDSFRSDENVRGGSAYLNELLARYHDNLALALAAYNAGPAAVDRYNGIPPYRETRVYVARVIHEFNRRVTARQGGQARRSRSVQPPSNAAASNLSASSTR